MYFTINTDTDTDTDDDGMMQGFSFDVRAEKKIEFDEGKRLYPASHPSADSYEKEPAGIISRVISRGHP